MSHTLRSRGRALDWLNFFVANLQTAFGPFIAIYLTGAHWTQGQIGWALSIGSITAMASQVPAGLVVDALPNKRRAAGWAIGAIMLSCLLLAALPVQLPVAVAEVLHGFASCMLNPAIAAVTLGVVALQANASLHLDGVGGHRADGQDGTVALTGARFGRNASFASIGNAFAAGLMAAVGYLVSARATLLLGALLAAPGLWALRAIGDVPPPPAPPARDAAPGKEGFWQHIPHLLSDRTLLVFLVCAVAYHFSNAAMLPLAAGQITKQAGNVAALVIGACILIPQLIVAVLSPLIGRYAGVWGMRTVVVAGFAALPLRGVLLSLTTDPYAVVAIELLDGISSATFGVMMPLVAADIARRTGHFNLCLGILGLGMGLGATLSTSVAGDIADSSLSQAFLLLAAVGGFSVLLGFALPGSQAAKLRRAARR
ncbi:MFS family permease [Endobacter medicaginis]|uniref:MFS family permease n=2 Tax=Endobacter medicaginis TaxID=1181271 RepID=A0A839V0E6_9PROT|nr:MFS transporter [Endobacter medicaginis]MBB3173880.1 MFS family permease [Endobacter medicaginis]MCX5475999.1 MFS transporter [Endobacter medicaginis]